MNPELTSDSSNVLVERPTKTVKLEEPIYEAIDLESIGYETIQEYLEREVEAVKLPDKVGKDTTYPGLILDGSSGVGKTQQVFALLKSKLTVVYRLLTTRPVSGEQPIYMEMRTVVDCDHSFLTLVDASMDALKLKTSDLFSVEFL